MREFFYPLPLEAGNKALWALTEYFRAPSNHINETDADIVDVILRRNGHAYLSVDRSCLEDSFEARIHLKIGEAPEVLVGFGGPEAVPILPNSG